MPRKKTINTTDSINKEIKTRNGENNHHGGYAGDGQDLIPTKTDGSLAKYDKYGNLVTENTGKGKGVMLKDYYACANKNISAPAPMDFVKSLTRPYYSINDMPISYIFNSIVEYFSSLTEPVYERVPKLDENDNPIKDSNGDVVKETKVVRWNYKNTPTLYGLAQALGVEKNTLWNYINTKQFSNNEVYDTSNNNTHSNGYNSNKQTTLPNTRNKILNINNISDKDLNLLLNIYGNSIFEERYSNRTEKDYKIDLLKRARQEVLKYHEQRLGTNENVSGSMFALMNFNDGWTNEHKVTVEIPSLLGAVKSEKELENLSDIEGGIILTEKDGVFSVPTNIDFDE